MHLLWANYFIQSSASVPIQFPSTVKTATVILSSRFQTLSWYSDDLEKRHWHLQTGRSLKNIYRTSGLAPQKHSNWATVWTAKTAEPQDEMPSNAHMLHLPEIWATARDVTSSSSRKKLCIWTAFTIRRFMPVLWLIQIKLKNSITEKWVCFFNIFH